MEVDSSLVRERLDKVWRGKAGRGGSRQGVLRPGAARQGKVAHVVAKIGGVGMDVARQRVTTLVAARRVKACSSTARQGCRTLGEISQRAE